MNGESDDDKWCPDINFNPFANSDSPLHSSYMFLIFKYQGITQDET